jgi:hypothetical protein
MANWKHIQKLDYKQLSFKCKPCHEYGHFAKDYKKQTQGKLQLKRKGNRELLRRKSINIKDMQPTKINPLKDKNQIKAKAIHKLLKKGKLHPQLIVLTSCPKNVIPDF